MREQGLSSITVGTFGGGFRSVLSRGTPNRWVKAQKAKRIDRYLRPQLNGQLVDKRAPELD